MLRNVSLGLILVLAACGNARVIRRTPNGGVIALDGDRGKAMEQATNEMGAHCGPGNYTITLEGEEPIGTDTVAREDTNYGERSNGRRTEGGATTTSAQSTRTAMEWRVHYSCGGGGAPPPGAGGGPAPGADQGPPPDQGGPPPGM